MLSCFIDCGHSFILYCLSLQNAYNYIYSHVPIIIQHTPSHIYIFNCFSDIVCWDQKCSHDAYKDVNQHQFVHYGNMSASVGNIPPLSHTDLILIQTHPSNLVHSVHADKFPNTLSDLSVPPPADCWTIVQATKSKTSLCVCLNLTFNCK